MEKKETGRDMNIRRNTFNRWVKSLGIFFGGTFCFLLILEIVIRIFCPQSRIFLKGLYRNDPVLCIKPVANYYGKERNTEYSTIVQTNSLGLRDREYPEGDKADFRILVLGDSFTFGNGVDQEDTYPKLLEKKLTGECKGKKCEVIDCGVPGVGTDYEYLLLKEVGKRFRPNVVLVGFYTGNDVADTICGHDCYEVRDGILCLTEEAKQRLGDIPWIKEEKRDVQREDAISGIRETIAQKMGPIVNDTKKFLKSHSHAYVFLVDRYYWIRERLLEPEERFDKKSSLHLYAYETYLLKEYPREIEEGWKLTKEYLKKIDVLSKSWGGKTMIVVIPSRYQVPIPIRAGIVSFLFRRERGKRENRNVQFDLEKPQKILKEFGKENSIPVCDLLPGFNERIEEEDLYYRFDVHWNKAGHKLAARVIYEQLKAENMLPGGKE